MLFNTNRGFLYLFAIFSFGFLFTNSAVASSLQCRADHPKITKSTPTSKIPDILLNAEVPYIHQLYERLTGVVASESDPIFRRARRLASKGRYLEAAEMITEDPNFLQIRVLNFSAPFTTGSEREGFDDLQALIIGITRDELDARLILTGNLAYQGRSSLGLPQPTLGSNAHYQAFEERLHSMSDDLVRVDDQWKDMEVAAGAFTTHAWAQAHYFEDTNRRPVAHSFAAFLCSPIEQWKTRGTPDAFIRRDVDRAPGGDPAVFQNHCRSCHGMMDAMGGAFAKMDYLEDQFTYIMDGVATKMNRDPMVFPLGYVTTDNSWVNQLDFNKSLDFGWRSPMKGKGVLEYAKMMANSQAYSRCLVQKTFKEVCGPKEILKNETYIHSLAKDFEDKGYNLKYLFANIASQDECIQHK